MDRAWIEGQFHNLGVWVRFGKYYVLIGSGERGDRQSTDPSSIIAAIDLLIDNGCTLIGQIQSRYEGLDYPHNLSYIATLKLP